jgi:hypothetical protein
MNHVHHDLIVAWAKGAEIEYFSNLSKEWRKLAVTPLWEPEATYRIKPEPKPDVILYAMVRKDPERYQAEIQHVKANLNKLHSDTCMFIFDGETGVLKDAQVLAKV